MLLNIILNPTFNKWSHFTWLIANFLRIVTHVSSRFTSSTSQPRETLGSRRATFSILPISSWFPTFALWTKQWEMLKLVKSIKMLLFLLLKEKLALLNFYWFFSLFKTVSSIGKMVKGSRFLAFYNLLQCHRAVQVCWLSHLEYILVKETWVCKKLVTTNLQEIAGLWWPLELGFRNISL